MTTYSTPGMGSYGSIWQAKGYCGGGNVAGLLGSLAGRPALVAGNAARVFSDLQAAREKVTEEPAIFAANDVGMYLPKLDHWVSLHADNLSAWKAVRWLHPQKQDAARLHSVRPAGGVEFIWECLTPVFALSGYFAMQIAWLMGCAPIILCGCPGAASRRFFEAVPREDFSYGGGTSGGDAGVRGQVVQEMRRLPEFKSAVRSMSGWTAEFFGGP
jgi:hypothetical protein